MSATLRPFQVFVACLLIVAAGPTAAQSLGDFDRALREVVQRFERDLDYEGAWEQLQKARRLVQGDQQETAFYLHKGIILGEMNRLEAARESFQYALELEPETKLPLAVSPKLERLFETVRAEVLARRRPPPELKAPAPPAPKPFEPSPQVVEQARARVPLTPLVLAGVGVAAAGVGTVFGLQSRSRVNDARQAQFLNETASHLDGARGSARVANVLFSTAGLAATGALITWLLSSNDGSALPSKEVR